MSEYEQNLFKKLRPTDGSGRTSMDTDLESHLEN